MPALVFFFGFTQLKAQGTTIALMIPPIGLLAAWTYYQKGYVDSKAAALVCLGFVVGGFVGAHVATGLSNVALEKIFGIILLFIALKMLL